MKPLSIMYFRIVKYDEWLEYYYIFSYILPAIFTSITLVFLSPILLRKCTIAETLHCGGDLRFFGDPFPESLVEMEDLRKTPKPSKSWTYEDLLYRNMRARIRNLRKPKFWKLLWNRWICRGCNYTDTGCEEEEKSVIDYILAIFWFPVSMLLVVLYVVPLFSVWANYVRKQAKETFLCSDPNASIVRRIFNVPLFFMQLFGIFIFVMMMWNLLLIGVQLFVFVSIDVLRNATNTLSKIIILLAIMIYIFSAFADFEDGYRELKSVTFALCIEKAESSEDEDTKVMVKLKPHEPLYVKTKDGEASIPRRIFYDICKVYRPYVREVISTFIRLFVSFALIIIVFSLIVKFQIFDELSGEWETLLTIGTVALPSMLGMLRSSSHQVLSDRRRKSKIRAWLEKITTNRRVRVNRNKSIKRVIGEYLFKLVTT